MKAVEQARLAVEAQLKAANLLPNAFLRVVFESEEAQNWQKRKLGEIAKTCSGSTPSRSNPDYYKGSISWVKTGELKDALILETEEHISELALKESSVRLLPPETLLVAMYGQGQTRGRTGLLKVPATTNQACFAILPNETFDSYFLQYWFRHNYQRLRQETEGRGGNQPNLNGDVLNNQIVSLPIEVNEQSKFVEKINEQMQAAETLKKSLAEKLEAVKKLPAALLRKAFAGEI
jgi:type I restriction enzyme, S subunit